MVIRARRVRDAKDQRVLRHHHLHARYAEHEALIDLHTLDILQGQVTRRALALTLEWAALHRDELRMSWEKARQGLVLDTIPPLD
jgi:hypothetical protein